MKVKAIISFLRFLSGNVFIVGANAQHIVRPLIHLNHKENRIKWDRLIVAAFVGTGLLTLTGTATASTNCKKTFTSGESITKFEWCFSDDGSVAKLEHPAGLEHINIGTITEGYCVSAGGTKRGETSGTNSNFMLQEPKSSGRKVRHETLDGALRIEQLFKETKSRKDREVNIEITMKVKNLTNSPLLNVYLTRFVDVDISNTTSSDVWAMADRSTSVTQPGSARLDLIPTTKTYPADSLLYSDFMPATDEACYSATADTTLEAAGDRSMGVRYRLGTIDRRKTKTVKFVYRINP
jgi:hypothetical protein